MLNNDGVSKPNNGKIKDVDQLAFVVKRFQTHYSLKNSIIRIMLMFFLDQALSKYG